jgi:DNA-binding CsgD family transcriptional regulator
MRFESPAHDLELLQKTLKALTVRAEFPIAFGGLVARDGAPLTTFVGTRGQTLNGLLIEPSQGLGGRAIAERRPVAATQYRNSTAITHRYDREVLAEHIVCLLAIPVVVDGSVRAVVYGAHRAATQLGDPVVKTSLALASALAWEYSVHDEVERRLAVLESEGRIPRERNHEDRDDRRELYAELRDIGRSVTDPALSERLASLGRGLGLPSSIQATPLPDHDHSGTDLSPRELDVLANVALGKRNAHIAGQLQLAESTVKSYLSSAMRKLDVTSRFEAVIVARRRGLIP